MELFERNSDKRKVEELLNSVISKIERLDKQGAIEDLTKIIAIMPNASEIYYTRGNEYYDLNQFDEAINDFKTTLKLDPKNEKALVNIAACKRQNGDMKGAYRDYTKAIKIYPTNSYLWYNRGHIKRYAMDIKGARQDFEMAVKLGDRDSQQWVEKCSMFDNEKSIDELIDSIPLNVDELINEGINYKDQGNWQQALGSFTRAVELYPLLENPARYKAQLEKEIGI